MKDENQFQWDKKPLPTGRHLLMIGVGVVCLLIANSALWFNQNIFNVETFTQVAEQSLSSESSRNALAMVVTNRLVQRTPLLRNLIDEPTQKIVAGLLETSAAETVMSRAVRQIQTVITSAEADDVVIDLVPLKDAVNRVLTVAEQLTPNRDIQVDASEIPDEITVIEAEKLPNIYSLGMVLLWLGPIALVSAITLLAVPIYKARKQRRALMKVFLWEGVGLAAAGVLGYVLGPLFKPPVLAQVSDPNMQTVVGNLYDAFLDKFNTQLWWFFILALIFLALALLFYYLQRPAREQTAEK